jgi:adenylate kinase family enzyme
MEQGLKQALSHVLWIGGATDSGKTTVAQTLADRCRLDVYHYDWRDLAHHEVLAKTMPVHRAHLDASLDERWVYPEPQELLRRSMRSFQDRFPLVIEDLLAMPKEPMIVAEGFGLLPELLLPLLSTKYQAIWFVPTEAFKWASMARRGKPSFGAQVSDPDRAKINLFTRDIMLAEYIKEQVLAQGYTLLEIDGSRSAEQITDRVEQHFASFLS